MLNSEIRKCSLGGLRCVCVCVGACASCIHFVYFIHTPAHYLPIATSAMYYSILTTHTHTCVYILQISLWCILWGKKNIANASHVCSAANSTQCTSTAHSFMVCQFKYEFTINKCGEYRQAVAVCWLPHTRARARKSNL